MACGRRKNLEIAGRNPLCGSRDGRRNFFTTRDGNRRRGNSEPPGKGQLRASARSSPAPPARRQLRATGAGETSCHPVLSRLWGLRPRGTLGATRQGGNPQGRPPSHPAKGKLLRLWRRGNPESRAEKKALSRSAKGRLQPFGLGETPVNWRKKAQSHPVREILGAVRLGGNPGLVAKRKARAAARGAPSHPAIRSRPERWERSWPW